MAKGRREGPARRTIAGRSQAGRGLCAVTSRWVMDAHTQRVEIRMVVIPNG